MIYFFILYAIDFKKLKNISKASFEGGSIYISVEGEKLST